MSKHRLFEDPRNLEKNTISSPVPAQSSRGTGPGYRDGVGRCGK
jgi:hypothetical protein